MFGLTIDEVKTISDRIRADVEALSEGEAYKALVDCKHWDFCADKAVQRAIHFGEVADLDELQDAKDATDAAENVAAEVKNEFAADAARLSELIAQGQTRDALDLVRDIATDSTLLSTAAEMMLAGLRGQPEQGKLL
jgi:hypothetical protein